MKIMAFVYISISNFHKFCWPVILKIKNPEYVQLQNLLLEDFTDKFSMLMLA